MGIRIALAVSRVGRSALSLIAFACASAAGLVHAASPPEPSRQRFCAGLSASFEEARDGRGAVFLVSYRPGPNEGEAPFPLRGSAFVYDNALALVALVACGDVPKAVRIGEALLGAVTDDRTFQDGRLRNAYRAGPSAPGQKALLPGWWDAAAGHWAEDAYQDGTSTGNVAWAALGLLTLHDATGDPRYLAAAGRLLGWIETNAGDPSGIGYTGGLDGFDPSQTKLTWASTEHNVDVAAAAEWFVRVSGDQAFGAMARSARAFVTRAFLAQEGCFVLGTTPEGASADPSHLALDTQLWPLLLPGALSAWSAALACAEQRFAVPGGFDFDNDRDGLWVEGTAQAALVYGARGERARSTQLLEGLLQDMSPSGWLYATRDDRITTGLKIGPHSVSADFFYYRRPHLGATAWAAIAAMGWNPFTGTRGG